MNTKDLTTISIFTALTTLGAFISIPIGTIPITLQTFFVLLSSLILKPELSFLSQLLYLLVGLSGIPIFAGFKGGIGHVLNPTFGFLIGFIFSAYITSKIFNNLTFSKINILISTVIGTIIIYIFGLTYMYILFNFVLYKSISILQVFKTACLIFLPGDLLKLILVSIIAYKIIPILNKNKEISY